MNHRRQRERKENNRIKEIRAKKRTLSDLPNYSSKGNPIWQRKIREFTNCIKFEGNLWIKDKRDWQTEIKKKGRIFHLRF